MNLRILLIGTNTPQLLSLYEELRKEPAIEIAENRILDPAEADVTLRRSSDPMLAIVGLDSTGEIGLELCETLRLQLPHVRWLMASSDASPQTILRALRAGAEEFLPLPAEGQELSGCVDRMRKKLSTGDRNGNGTGKLVSVFSAQGGVGCTTIATNLALSLAARQYSVCLVDLVLQFGSVTSFLDLTPSFTILDFTEKLDRFDPLLLEGSLAEHASGVRVLPEPFRPEEASSIRGADVARIFDTLTRSFNFVIVDLPKEIDDARLPALEKADLVVFPMEMNVPSIKRSQRALRLIERLGIPLQRVALVANRFLNDKVLSIESVGKTLGKIPLATLPNDYVSAQSAINQGVPIVQLNPGSLLAKAYGELTQKVLHELGLGDAERNRSRRSGLFGWMQRALPRTESVH